MGIRDMDNEGTFGQLGDNAEDWSAQDWSISPQGEPDLAAYPLEPDSPTPEKRTKAILVSVAVVAVLVVGAIALVVHGSSNHSRNLDATVAASVNDAIASKTASMNLTTDISSASGDITASGPGVIDFTRDAVSVRFEMHVDSQSLPVTAVYLGGTIYEEIPGLDQLEPGKSWLSIDLSGVANAGTGMFAGGGNPAAMLALLTERGAVVKPTGRAVIDGVQTKSYQVTIPPAVIERDLRTSQLPPWMKAAAENVSFSGAGETVYIDHSNRLRRYEIDMSVAAQGQNSTIKETVDLSNYGTPANIAAPPASATVGFEQFLKDEQAAGPSPA
jgi:hypothetical protein